jgi:NAD(P)-dependent dehydrogenase (short-subunit alcohol dehydrogenase family)
VCLVLSEVRYYWGLGMLSSYTIFYIITFTIILNFDFYVACVIYFAFLSIMYKFANKNPIYEYGSLKGKVCIVTGVSKGGIGYSTVRGLLALDATVIVATRDQKKAEAAILDLVAETKNPNVKYMSLDLTSIASVQNFVTNFLKTNNRLDVLINNAGVNTETKELTKDGFEITWQVDYFSHYVLTMLMLDTLKKSHGRIIHTSSVAAEFAGDLEMDKVHGEVISFFAYANAKLAQAVLNSAMGKTLNGEAYTFAYHPGGVSSQIYEKSSIGSIVRFMFAWRLRTIDQGAETAVFLAANPDVIKDSGKFFYSSKVYTPIEKMMCQEKLEKRVIEKSQEYMRQFIK